MRAFHLYIALIGNNELLHSKLQTLFPWATESDKGKVIAILIVQNLNCVFQWPITAMMWGYHYKVRPFWVIPVFLPLSFGCAVIGGVLPAWYQRKADKSKQNMMLITTVKVQNEDEGNVKWTPPLLRQS
jgi:hypothetical protein